MKPKKSPCEIETRQGNLLEDLPGTLHKFIDLNHPIPGDRIGWRMFSAYGNKIVLPIVNQAVTVLRHVWLADY